MFNCRQLDDKSVLVIDYNVDCDHPQHDVYKTAAAIVIVLVSLGVPFGNTRPRVSLVVD